VGFLHFSLVSDFLSSKQARALTSLFPPQVSFQRSRDSEVEVTASSPSLCSSLILESSFLRKPVLCPEITRFPLTDLLKCEGAKGSGCSFLSSATSFPPVTFPASLFLRTFGDPSILEIGESGGTYGSRS